MLVATGLDPQDADGKSSKGADNVRSEDTTRFSGVEFQLRPTPSFAKQDTTDFSSVESQLQPNESKEKRG